MQKWEFYNDLWIAFNVSKAGNTRYIVCAKTMGSRGEREVARFKSRAEAKAFCKGMAMAKM